MGLLFFSPTQNFATDRRLQILLDKKYYENNISIIIF